MEKHSIVGKKLTASQSPLCKKYTSGEKYLKILPNIFQLEIYYLCMWTGLTPLQIGAEWRVYKTNVINSALVYKTNVISKTFHKMLKFNTYSILQRSASWENAVLNIGSLIPVLPCITACPLAGQYHICFVYRISQVRWNQNCGFVCMCVICDWTCSRNVTQELSYILFTKLIFYWSCSQLSITR